MQTFLKYLLIGAFSLCINLLNAQEESTYSIFISGNTFGKNTDNELLNSWKQQAGKLENFAILLAGNSVDAQTGKFPGELLLNEKHPLLIAPGKTEWAGGTRKGKDFIKELTDALPDKYNNPVILPDEACPGPTEVVLSEHLAVILIDTWWWVYKYDRRFNKCGIENRGDVLIQIEDAIRRHYADKHVVVAGHHSLKSYGNSCGYFSAEQWLLQLPYTFFRKLPGTRYDNQHPDFKSFRSGLLLILKKYPDVVYLSAGEANLQYFQHDNNHFVISGSWQNREYVRKNLPEFSSDEKGFAQLTFSPEGKCGLSFYNADDVLFKKILYEKKFPADKHKTIVVGHFPDSVVAIASTKYNISPSGYTWMGQNYREVWATPVKAQVFDIGTKKGGLKILKRGGGQQTFSLRLEDNDGRQYVLRTIDKYVEGAVPEELHKTFAVDLVQDQISASNPYAAPVVATLAGYVGVFHTNPEVVYIPDDSRFGIYRSDVAGKLFLFEERPDGNRSDVDSFGHSENIISTAKVIEKTTASSSHVVDENAVLRARLFDIVVNDWDRHDDQWRWAGFEQNGQTVYKPIPRDRDQAFFVNEGVIPCIAARKWLLPKIQGFTENTENMEGQSFNARYFDRSFLTQSSWDEWQRQIDSLQILLSPEKIDSAMYAFPKEVYPLCAPETARILKTRLENLESMARNLYLSLTKEVSITGTNKSNYFEILTLGDSLLQISGYELIKNGQKGRRFYHRTLSASETRKIHLYGLAGNDQFEIEGNHTSKIELNIIVGKNNVEIVSDQGLKRENIFVFGGGNTEISPDRSVSLKKRFDPKALEYDREHFEYDVVYPGFFSGYNPDDGIFVGGGPVFTKYSRYRQQLYEIMGNYALATNAVNLRFGTQQSFPLRNVEINFNVQYNSPEYAGNYFGMGNETAWEVPRSEKEFYRLRMSRFYTELDFVKWLDAARIHKAGPGLFYSYSDAEKTAGRFISRTDNDLTVNDLASHAYAGAYFKYEWNTLTDVELKIEEEFAGSKTLPTRGMNLNARLSYFTRLNEETDHFLKLSGDWVNYFSFSQRPRVVYALRVGGEKLFGNYAFHEAATLGRTENLRGYRESRFYGDASFYLNAEVRIRMKQFRTYLLNGTAGVLLFNDTGRVWLDGENSKKWHNGTGLGLWFSPFDMAVMSVSYAASADDRLFNFTVNYQF
ncbi:MAG TPA: BamA/TamA family outer membrane protein [Draconibacterium sp.]|nr:BamA/TamA family outer membrane protein [Draconibacterium sp.]